MIVLCTDDTVRLVRQVDHQRQCGVMARNWGNRRFTRPAPYAPLVAAAEWHDEGWREWDEAPEVDAGGRVINFPELDRAVHAAMYRRAIAAAVERGPRVGLLVSMHGQGLYEKRMGLDGPPPPRGDRPQCEREFIADQQLLQAELRTAIGDGPGLARWAWAGYRLLQAWDVLSLYLCWHGLAHGEEWVLPRVPRRAGDDGIDIHVRPVDAACCALAPWPFAVPRLELSVPAREIRDVRYADARSLRVALAEAPVRTLELAAVPG